jgi:hypothetical protein
MVICRAEIQQSICSWEYGQSLAPRSRSIITQPWANNCSSASQPAEAASKYQFRNFLACNKINNLQASSKEQICRLGRWARRSAPPPQRSVFRRLETAYFLYGDSVQ